LSTVKFYITRYTDNRIITCYIDGHKKKLHNHANAADAKKRAAD